MRLPFMRWIHPSALQPCSGEDDLFPFSYDPERSMKLGWGCVGRGPVISVVSLTTLLAHLLATFFFSSLKLGSPRTNEFCVDPMTQKLASLMQLKLSTYNARCSSSKDFLYIQL